MSKKHYLISLIIIFTAAFTAILACSKSLTLSFEMPLQATGGSVTTADESVVQVLSADCAKGYMTVRFEYVGMGRSAAHINWEPADNVELNFYDLDLSFTAGYFGGLHEKLSGVFSGWRLLIAAITVLCCVSAFALLRSYFQRKDTAPFSYTTLLYAALGIFFSVTAVICLYFALNSFIDPTVTLWFICLRISAVCEKIIVCSSILTLAFALLLVISKLCLLRCEDCDKVNFRSFILAIFLVIIAALFLILSRPSATFSALSCIYAAILFYLDCLFFAVMLCTLPLARRNSAYDKDFITIPGCKIRPDGSLCTLLQERADRALLFAAQQEKLGGKKAIFVASGGKRSDEVISEAEAIARYLRQHGVEDERILIEKNSQSIWENMCCCKALIDQRRENAAVLILTDDFLVFESGIMAKNAGWSPEIVGAASKWYFRPTAIIKEFFSLLASKFWIHIGFILAFVMIISALTLLF